MVTHTLLIAHLLATAMMAGLIWFVQCVHYPLMASVGAECFVAYEQSHVRRTGWVVGPLMLCEAGTAVALLFAVRDGWQVCAAWAGLALLVMVWVVTFTVSVPCHDRLGRGFDERVVWRLVASNWWRTAGWTLRVVLAAAMMM